jgi:integrase
LKAAETSRYYAALVLIASTGLRRGEALALSWDTSIVNLDEGWLRVRKTVGRVGKVLVFSEPKTDRSRRTVPLSPAVAAVLRKHKAAQLPNGCGLAVSGGNRASSSPPNWADPSTRATYCGSSRLPPRRPASSASVHTLRHSAAVGWLEAGVHIKAVADLLGHSSISITGDIYGHTTDTAARGAVDGWSNALGL